MILCRFSRILKFHSPAAAHADEIQTLNQKLSQLEELLGDSKVRIICKGVFLFHEDSDFFNYQIFMRLICNSPSVGRVESSLNGKSRIKNSLGEHALGHRGNPKEIGSRKGQAHDANGMEANMGPLSSNLSLNTQIRSSSLTQKHFILTYHLTPPWQPSVRVPHRG